MQTDTQKTTKPYLGTHKDIGNISRKIQKASSSQLLPLLTDNEENHEALFVLLVLIFSTERAC